MRTVLSFKYIPDLLEGQEVKGLAIGQFCLIGKKKHWGKKEHLQL